MPAIKEENSREKLLKSLAIPDNSKFCLVLGRLFKLHPIFDDTIKEILTLNTLVYVVFIFEKNVALNRAVFNRFNDTIGPILSQRIRFSTMDWYSQLVKYATAALDTFPYGGMDYSN
jgi:hypothetical protein